MRISDSVCKGLKSISIYFRGKTKRWFIDLKGHPVYCTITKMLLQSKQVEIGCIFTFHLNSVINRAPGLKLVVETLIRSLKPIGNIILICCAFFIIFGILGVQVIASVATHYVLFNRNMSLFVFLITVLILSITALQRKIFPLRRFRHQQHQQ